MAAERGGDEGAHDGGDEAPAPGLTRGWRNVRWIEANCRIPEGRFVGKRVRLRDWQRQAILKIYDNPAGTRRAIISFGRKNAKTTLAAFLLLLHLCGPEARENSELYSTAMAKEQAAKTFDLAAKIIRLSPSLRAYVGIRDNNKHLYYRHLGTVYKALSSDATNAFGFSPVFCVHDELGQVIGPRHRLFEAMETGASAHEEPLSIIISTQAPGDGDLLSILIDDAQSGADPHTVLILYAAPEDMDFFSEAAIRAANPAFGDFMNDKEVLGLRDTAKRMPAREAEYRNLILNQRVSLHSAFIPRALWVAGAQMIDERVFESGPVYVGLDLSARNDLTAMAMVGRDERKRWHCKLFFYVPQQGITERASRDRAPYDLWAQQGHLTAIPGASIEYREVAEQLIGLCDKYQVERIAFDRWRMDVFQGELARLERDLPLQEFGQGYKDMAPALDAFESELMNGRILHGGHPVLRWCAANAIAVRDPAGNRKLDKSKSTGRIDGIVALVMAIGEAMKDDNNSAAISAFFDKPVSTAWR